MTASPLGASSFVQRGWELSKRASLRVVDTYVMNVMWLDAKTLPPRRAHQSHVEVRRLTERELARAEADVEYDLEPGFIEHALAKGDECFGVFDEDGTLGSYGWYASTATAVDPNTILAWNDLRTRYMYKGFTLPSRRGRGLYTHGLIEAAHALDRERGVGRIFALIRRSNESSIAAASRAGYRAKGTLAISRRFGHRAFVSTLALEEGVRVYTR